MPSKSKHQQHLRSRRTLLKGRHLGLRWMEGWKGHYQDVHRVSMKWMSGGHGSKGWLADVASLTINAWATFLGHGPPHVDRLRFEIDVETECSIPEEIVVPKAPDGRLTSSDLVLVGGGSGTIGQDHVRAIVTDEVLCVTLVDLRNKKAPLTPGEYHGFIDPGRARIPIEVEVTG